MPYISLGIVAMGVYFVPMNLLSMTVGRTAFIPIFTLTAGAVNVGLNLLMVPRMGALAAAISRDV